MKTTVEPLEGNLVKLTVTVPASEVDRIIADRYADVAKKVRIPGFRAGKAPRPVIDRYVGRDQVLVDAQQEVVERTYPEAIDAEGLRPIEQPDLGELSGVVEGEDYTYVAEVALRPELTLTGDWRHMKVTVPPSGVAESDVELQLKLIADRFATLVPIEDRGVETGDFVLLSFTGLVDGEAYEGNTVDKFLYELGRGQMPQEFDDAMLGAKPGDTVDASFVIPETSNTPDLVGKTATFEIAIHEIKMKQLPEFDEEFAASAGGFDSMEQMRAEIRSRLETAQETEREQEVARALRTALVEHLEGDVPEPMIMSRRDSMLRDFFSNLEQRGISLQDYVQGVGMNPEQITNEITAEAESRVRQELALEALFRAEGMEVSDEDVDADLAEIAKSADKTPEELRKQWEDAGVLGVLKEQVMQRKAYDWLTGHVEMVEESAQEPATAATAEEKPAKPKRPRRSAKKKEE